ncbi:Nitric oxide synthase-interacting protein like protein [Trachymyrmex cornetzi]|uniref:Nitric oxide synthase-interacting protein like protein n=1 Tax=Trachymyrmex cornetzi TaxID=471704 RepID=A0A151IRH5_9HYME|nr:Nitric oxide synthase-interacting protein like protein [Trachymyrmex cornetzi]
MYHEKKDAAASGYGTNTQRVGKDSVKDFDCCCLTLQPCRNPVITKDGFLFDKEAILEYILTKKKEYARKLKEYEKQKQKEEGNLTDKTIYCPVSGKPLEVKDLIGGTGYAFVNDSLEGRHERPVLQA